MHNAYQVASRNFVHSSDAMNRLSGCRKFVFCVGYSVSGVGRGWGGGWCVCVCKMALSHASSLMPNNIEYSYMHWSFLQVFVCMCATDAKKMMYINEVKKNDGSHQVGLFCFHPQPTRAVPTMPS